MPRPYPLRLLLTIALLSSGCAAVAAPSEEPLLSSVVLGAAHNDTSTPFKLESLPALIQHRYDGRALRVGGPAQKSISSVRYPVTYRSGRLTLSGQLFVPRRPGRFPLVVLAHGYEHPTRYRSGFALAREQAFLAARGYVVLLPDYRNHGKSDGESSEPMAEPRGYAEDVVNAIVAVRRADLPYVDASRVAVVGRSMGGGVALNAVAARPSLVDALVLYSPVSASAADNYERWVRGRGPLDLRVRATYGAPGENPGFWREASVRTYLHRVDVPVQVHHGTADVVCPVEWSRATVAALRDAGQTVEYHEYPGEAHRFDRAWPVMADRVVEFLDRQV